MVKIYKVNAVLLTGGYYGGNFVVAENKDKAIEKVRDRYRDYGIAEYEAKSLGEITGEIIE